MLIAEGARVKIPGEKMTGEPVELIARHHQRPEKSPYERLLGDAIRGDGSLFSDDADGRSGVGGGRQRAQSRIAGRNVQARLVGSRNAPRTIVDDGEGWHDPAQRDERAGLINE